jgi:hypothetical protein
MLERLRRWRYGVCRVPKEKLGKIKNLEIVRFMPSKTSFSNLKIMERILNLIHRRKSTFSLEIWHKEDFGFYIHATKREDLEEFLFQLNTVYPSSKMEFARYSTPELDGYLSGGCLVLKGQEFGLKTLDDFDYDPLVHIIEAIDTDCIIQILFKPARYVVETVQGKFPVFKCRIAVIACSDDWIRARKACERVLNGFSVFSTHVSQLEPKTISFPVFRNSYSLLKGVMKRKFSIFPRSFLVTSRELASFGHFPFTEEILLQNTKLISS